MENARVYSSRAPLFALALFIACTSSPDARHWTIELTSSGGLTGRGNGAVVIDSNGAVAITDSGGKRCTFTATADELRRIEALVAESQPGTWNPSYKPENTCCDRFEYALKLERDGKTYTTEWIDDPLPMPKELTALANAIRSLRCRTENR